MSNMDSTNSKIELILPPARSIVLPCHFTPEDNHLLLEIGIAAILAMKKEMYGLGEKEKERIKGELEAFYREEINHLTVAQVVLKKEY